MRDMNERKYPLPALLPTWLLRVLRSRPVPVESRQHCILVCSILWWSGDGEIVQFGDLAIETLCECVVPVELGSNIMQAVEGFVIYKCTLFWILRPFANSRHFVGFDGLLEQRAPPLSLAV